eukprot:2460763-Rhodomonas_salina.3
MLREWGRRHQEIVHVGISLAPREKSSVQTLEAEVACSAQERDKISEPGVTSGVAQATPVTNGFALADSVVERVKEQQSMRL